MILLNKIIDFVVKELNVDPLKSTLYLFLLALFIWLSREIKNQQNDSIQSGLVLSEKRIMAYSSILFEARQSKDGQDHDSFFKAVYASFHIFDKSTFNHISEVLKSDQKEEVQVQIIQNSISKQLEKQFNSMEPIENSENRLSDDLIIFLFKANRLIKPYYISVFIICAIFIFLGVAFTGKSLLWMIIKPASLFLFGLFLVLLIDLFREKRVTKATAQQLIPLTLVFGLISISSGIFAWVFLTIFLILFFRIMYSNRHKFTKS